MLHILAGKEKSEGSAVETQVGMSVFQKKREADRKAHANKSFYSWNTLFVGTNAVAETLAERLKIEKSEFLAGDDVNRWGLE